MTVDTEGDVNFKLAKSNENHSQSDIMHYYYYLKAGHG